MLPGLNPFLLYINCYYFATLLDFHFIMSCCKWLVLLVCLASVKRPLTKANSCPHLVTFTCIIYLQHLILFQSRSCKRILNGLSFLHGNNLEDMELSRNKIIARHLPLWNFEFRMRSRGELSKGRITFLCNIHALNSHIFLFFTFFLRNAMLYLFSRGPFL